MTDTIRTHTDYPGFLTLKPEPWVEQASCASSGNPDAWFPEKGEPTSAAKAICNGCPVKTECGEYAVRNRIFEGIWSGKSPRARQHERERAARAARGTT